MKIHPFVLLVITCWCAPLAAQVVAPEVKKDEALPPDTALLQLELPKGATATLDGKDIGEVREHRFGDLGGGKWKEAKLSVTLESGQKIDRPILLKGGWRVPLRIEADSTRPGIVVQTGHKSFYRAMYSPDAKLILTSGEGDDAMALVWDARTGILVRRLQGTKAMLAVGFTSDVKNAVTLMDGQLLFWNLSKGEIAKTTKVDDLHLASASFSRDCRSIIVGGRSEDYKKFAAIVLDAETAKEVRRFDVSSPVVAIALSADGKMAALSLYNREMQICDVATGKALQTIVPAKDDQTYAASALDFSPNGDRLLSGHSGHIVQVWDAKTGQRLQIATVQEEMFDCAVAFHPNGKQFLSSGRRNDKWEMNLWDAATGQRARRYEGQYLVPAYSQFSPDGRHVLSAGGQRAIIWDTESGRVVRSLRGGVGSITSFDFDENGRQVFVARGSISQWNLDAGKPTRTLPSYTYGSPDIRFLPKTNEFVAFGGINRLVLRDDKKKNDDFDPDFPFGKKGPMNGGFVENNSIVGLCGRIHDAATGEFKRELIWNVGGLMPGIYHVATDPSGETIYAAGPGPIRKANPLNQVIDISPMQTTSWDARTGARNRAFDIRGSGLNTTAFFLSVSPDRKRLAHGTEREVVVCDMEGKSTYSYKTIAASPWSGAFSPDGQLVLIGYGNGDLCMLPAGHAEPIAAVWSINAHASLIYSVGFGPDAKWIFSSSHDRSLQLREAASGRLLQTFAGHEAAVVHVIMTKDGRRLISGSSDGTVRIWDVATGDELASIAPLDSDDWLVTTPDGFFDGSHGGREKVGYRIVGLEVVAVDRFFQDFYRPGLLASIWKGERPNTEVKFGEQKPPTIKLLAPKDSGQTDQNEITIEAEVTDAGGGISGPWLVHNGTRVRTENKSSRQGNKLLRSFKLLLAPGENRIEIRAASADGSWESEPATITLKLQKLLEKADLHVLAVGINSYSESSLNLKFASTDSKAMAALFQKRGTGLFRTIKIHALADAEATQANIQREAKAIALQAKPEDVLVVFLAGHGTAIGQRYYYVTHEFQRTDAPTVEEDVRKQGLAGDVLISWLEDIRATKRIIILDTCQSGAALGLKKGGRNPFAFQGAIETLRRSNGAHTIAAAAAGEEAREIEELGHGLLTYTLLAGVKAVDRGPLADKWIKPSNAEEVIDVFEWFSYAAGNVPRIAEKYYKARQNVSVNSTENIFPVLPIK